MSEILVRPDVNQDFQRRTLLRFSLSTLFFFTSSNMMHAKHKVSDSDPVSHFKSPKRIPPDPLFDGSESEPEIELRRVLDQQKQREQRQHATGDLLPKSNGYPWSTSPNTTGPSDIGSGLEMFEWRVMKTSRDVEEALFMLDELKHRRESRGRFKEKVNRGKSQVQQVPRPVLADSTTSLTPDHYLPTILTNWNWVSESTIQCIKDGTFDAANLNQLCNPVLRTSGETPEDLRSFLSAWSVYMSIRTIFAPERAPGMAMFTARIIEFSQWQGDFEPVANYALSYLGRYQNAPPQQWFNICDALYVQFIRPHAPPNLPSSWSTSSLSASNERSPNASIIPHGFSAPSYSRASFAGTIAPFQPVSASTPTMPPALSSRFNIRYRAQDHAAAFMEYYIPLERQARLAEHEQRVANAQMSGVPPPTPPNVHEISVPTRALRHLEFFISSMNIGLGVHGREQFITTLFNYHDLWRSFTIKLIVRPDLNDPYSSPEIQKLMQYFSKICQGGNRVAVQTFRRYAGLLHYCGHRIRSPSNCMWTFLFLSHCIYERIATEFPIAMIGNLTSVNTRKAVDRELKELLSAKGDFDKIQPGPHYKISKLGIIKVYNSDFLRRLCVRKTPIGFLMVASKSLVWGPRSCIPKEDSLHSSCFWKGWYWALGTGQRSLSQAIIRMEKKTRQRDSHVGCS